MNENFINTWVSNVELERTPVMRDYAAQRFEDGSRTFNRTHPLAQAIMKGWKEHSPSDSLIISPKLELMGRLPVNERSKLRPVEHYLLFLKRSLAGKLPGFGENTLASQSIDWEPTLESSHLMTSDLKVVLTEADPEQEILSTFRTPERGYQDYTVIEIDATEFANDGWLTIEIRVGDAEAAGSFDLFDGNSVLPTKGVPNALVSAWDISPNDNGIIEYYFDRGQVFKLGATGNWFSKEGSTNAFVAKISVEPSQKPEPRKPKEVSSTHLYESPEDAMNAFVKAFKNLDTEAMHAMLTADARHIFGIDDVPEDMRAQISQTLSRMKVLSSEYVGDEFHFRLRVPAGSPPEVSVKMRKVGDEWFIYEIE